MCELKSFESDYYSSWADAYAKIDEDVNKYANDNNLSIKDVHYERFRDGLVVNVLFSTLPNELWLL